MQCQRVLPVVSSGAIGGWGYLSCERGLRNHCQIENALPARQRMIKIAMPHSNGSDFAMANT